MISADGMAIDGQLLWPDGRVRGGRLVLDGERIATIEATDATDGAIVAPGFIDLQVNGVDQVSFADADADGWRWAIDTLADRGTTTAVPTVITAPEATYRQVFAVAGEVRGDAAWADRMPGIHLEGPFLTTPGAHPPTLLARLPHDLLHAIADVVCLVTLAPDAGDADAVADAVATLSARQILVSLGHSAADAGTTRRAVDAGARMVTHLGNAMGALHHRAPGLAGVALTDDRLTVGIIADGVHTAPEWVALAFSAKGAGATALVTDAIAHAHPSARRLGIEVRQGAPRLADGTIAGSVLSMHQAVATARAAGVPLADALTAATATPARLLGLADRGTLEPGRRGDLVALDPETLEPIATWVAGRRRPAAR